MIERLLKVIKQEIVLITVGIQAIGFTFYVIYFNYFNIPILYYMNLTDILVYTLMVIILYSSYLMVLRYLVIEGFLNFFKINGIKINPNSWSWIIVFIIHFFFCWAYYEIISRLSYQLPIASMVWGILVSGTFLIGLVSNPKDLPKNAEIEIEEQELTDIDKEAIKRISIVKGFLILFIILYMCITVDAGMAKKNDTTITFTSGSRSYYVGYKSKVKLIGETSNYLFTYDTLTKISTAYNKAEVQSLKFYR